MKKVEISLYRTVRTMVWKIGNVTVGGKCLFEYHLPPCRLTYIQQRKLRFPAFEQHLVPFPLVVAESDVLLIDVAVASL